MSKECTYCFGTGEHFNGEEIVPCKRCPEGDKKKKEKDGKTGDSANTTEKKGINSKRIFLTLANT